MEKVGRNDPCPCGSGAKYKKCCETKQKHKKFHAERISADAPQVRAIKNVQVLSGLFNQKAQAVASPQPPAQFEKEEKNREM